MGNERATGLPTPEQTPEPDLAKTIETLRNNGVEERKKWATEAKKEIKRVNACGETSYSQVLGVKDDATEEEKTAAWRQRGCLLHPKQIEVHNIKDVKGNTFIQTA